MTANPETRQWIKWRKLARSKPWRPKVVGEELVGYYLGTTTRDGNYGQYKVAMFAVPDDDGHTSPFLVSGTSVIQALNGGNIQKGMLIRVVWKGWKNLNEDRRMKLFDVFAAEGSIDIDDAVAYMNRLEEE